jgi:hypothetical protein
VRRGGGKSKGSAWEREVSVMLSRWVSSNTQDDVFWRSALSGGRATVAHRKGNKLANQVGDISCIHPIGHHFISRFAPECKFYSDLEIQGLLTGRGKLLAFWQEITTQANRYNKLPFLVAKQNRLPATICLTSRGLIQELSLTEQLTVVISKPHDLYIMLASVFIEHCKPFT